MIYYNFIETDDFEGYYELGSNNTIVGSMKQPGDCLKLQNTDSIVIGDVTLQTSTIDIILKENWFKSYLKYINISDYISPSEYTILYNYFNTLSFLNYIGEPSIAYLTKNDGSINDYPYDDGFITNEYSLGMNVYLNNFIKDYAYTLPNNNLKNVILNNHIDNAYISNICNVTYNGISKDVWCFDKITYNYNVSDINPSFQNGGGKDFGEVKFAGDKIQAHYKVRKDISPNDPTIGMCSGVGEPFCMGDRIVIVDTTCYTSNDIEWTWVGDFTSLNRIMHIADVTNPCYDYRNVSVDDMLFPLRVIQFCRLSDFN